VVIDQVCKQRLYPFLVCRKPDERLRLLRIVTPTGQLVRLKISHVEKTALYLVDTQAHGLPIGH
jgi:hypothetical protein